MKDVQRIPPVLPTVPRRFQYLLPGRKFSRHRHRIPHISIVLAGEFEEEGELGRIRVKPGDVLVRSAFTSHAQEIFRPTRIYNAALPLQFAYGCQIGHLRDPDRVIRCWENDPNEALGLALEQMRPVDRPKHDWREALARTLCEGGRLYDWARGNGFHPASLARGFRRNYGVPPARFRTEGRARRALNEIFSTDEPLAAIAYNLDFADQAHMCREVRRLTGLSPSQWRRLKKFNISDLTACDIAAMNRREFNTGAIAGALVALAACRTNIATPIRPPAAPVRTLWSVKDSEAYDALCFWAPLAGEPESSRRYADEVREFAPRLDPRALQAIKALYEQTAAAGNVLTHSACRVFSAGPHSTIDDLIHSAENIDAVLKPRHLLDPEWEGEELWERYRQLMPVATMVLGAMKRAGFSDFRARLYQSKHAGRVDEVLRAIGNYNAVSEVQLLTGRAYEPNVEVALTYFSYPRSMRMLDQQFVTWAGYSDETILNNSAHELMHPPLDLRGKAMQGAISKLFANGFLVDIVTRRDPALGDVGDLPNYVEECMVQALDQIASERRGAQRRAVDFFTRSNGADVLAACFYGLLKQDKYERTGGNFENWVDTAVRAGRFSPKSLDAAATAVLGASPASVWKPYELPHAS